MGALGRQPDLSGAHQCFSSLSHSLPWIAPRFYILTESCYQNIAIKTVITRHNMRTLVFTISLLLVPFCSLGQPTESEFNPSHEGTLLGVEEVGINVHYSSYSEPQDELYKRFRASDAFEELEEAVEEYEEERKDGPIEDGPTDEETEPSSDTTGEKSNEVIHLGKIPFPDRVKYVNEEEVIGSEEELRVRVQVADSIRESDVVELHSAEEYMVQGSVPVLRVEVENIRREVEGQDWMRPRVTLVLNQKARLSSGQKVSIDTYSMSYSGERMATEEAVSLSWAQEAVGVMLERFLRDLEASRD